MMNHKHLVSLFRILSLMILLAVAVLQAQEMATETAASAAETTVTAGTPGVSQNDVEVTARTLPREVRFSGVLEDGAGQALTGVQGVTFALYAEQEGGAPLWLETQTVEADAQGRYTVLLGAMRSDGLPQDLFTTNEARWLGVQVNQPGVAEQARVLLVSVPYALKAADAETLGGLPAAAFVLSADVLATRVGKSGGLTGAAATDGLPMAAAGTAGNIAKFDVGGSTLVDSVLTESNGKIGLGTDSPQAALEVSGGQIRIAGGSTFPSSGTGLEFQYNTGTSVGAMVATARGPDALKELRVVGAPVGIHVDNSGIAKLTVDTLGKVGIGTVSPQAALEVSGG